MGPIYLGPFGAHFIIWGPFGDPLRLFGFIFNIGTHLGTRPSQPMACQGGNVAGICSSAVGEDFEIGALLGTAGGLDAFFGREPLTDGVLDDELAAELDQ